MTVSKRFLSSACVFVVLFALAWALAFAPGAAYAKTDSSASLAAGSPVLKVPSSIQSANPTVKYRGYVGSAWTSSWTKSGKALGTSGKMIQMLKVKVANDGVAGSVKYRIYSLYKGWQGWASNGKAVGETGWKFRGIQMKLSGKLGKYFDIVYRVYLEGSGWMPWTLDGGVSGSTGALGQVEKLQVKLVRKGSAQKLTKGAYYFTPAKNPTVALAVPGSSSKSGKQLSKASYAPGAFNERFFVRKVAGNAVTLQSCVSGMYLCERNGKIVQRPWLNSKKLRWKLSWNGGYQLMNVGTGHYLALSGSKAVASSDGAAWELTISSVIPDGTYTLSSKGSGVTAAIKGGSTDDGASVIMDASAVAGAKAFVFQHLGSNVYRIKNARSGSSIEVKGASTKEGAMVRQNATKSAALQKWKATLDENGGFIFTNRASGKALSAAAAGATGERVISSTFAGLDTQRWLLDASSYRKPAIGPDTGPGAIAGLRAEEYAKTVNSGTNYLITVDLTNHWVCIFNGTKGNRRMIQSWECSTGAPNSPTPTGEYSIGYRQYSFGEGYTCYYATAFIGYTYLLHSVKYVQNTFTILDGRLGESISEGCVRLDIENARWIYNTIPDGTKVKIYY